MTTDPCEALKRVEERIAAACERSGRERTAVRLVAVSKTFPAAHVRRLLGCGQTLFGEARVQEAQAKIPEVDAGAHWHLIGRLQRNKARHAVGLFDLIHSVDGEKLAHELDRRAQSRGLTQPILIEVNLAGEESKAGADEERLWPLIEEVRSLGNLDLQGLMTLPPHGEGAEAARPWFAKLRAIRDEASRRAGIALPELSMGMTDDFEVAIEEGATLIRIGRAIFGERSTSR